MVVIYQCGARKHGVPMAAGSIYTGSLFVCMQRAARALGGRRFIASAKHGLILESQIIAPYDQRLPKGGDPAWGARLHAKLLELTTPAERDVIVALCSKDYLTGWARDVGALTPIAGLKMGEAMAVGKRIYTRKWSPTGQWG